MLPATNWGMSILPPAVVGTRSGVGPDVAGATPIVPIIGRVGISNPLGMIMTPSRTVDTHRCGLGKSSLRSPNPGMFADPPNSWVAISCIYTTRSSPAAMPSTNTGPVQGLTALKSSRAMADASSWRPI